MMRLQYRTGYKRQSVVDFLERLKVDLERFDVVTYFDVQAQNEKSAIKIVAQKEET
jgi:hypothetical protein|tara:strand:+ start:480 stop:647 length:168 start_codon:yes stop_codon:yes gene_type:complete